MPQPPRKPKPPARKPRAVPAGRPAAQLPTTLHRPPGALRYTTGELRLPPSKRRKRKPPRRLATLAIGLALAGGLFAFGALQSALGFLGTLNPASGHAALDAGQMLTGLTPFTERQTLLVLGSDFSYGEGQRLNTASVRSDTILVVGADPGRGSLQVISVPRDTRVLVHGAYGKINSALAVGGPELACRVVGELIGQPIRQWAMISPDALEHLVDALGGVEVAVEKPMRYTDRTAHLEIDLKPGIHRLHGKEAHQFVRFRHDELGDIGRVQRQQAFMRATVQQVLRPDTVLRLPSLLEAVHRDVHTNLAPAETMRWALFARSVGKERVRMTMLPGRFSPNPSVSYWLVDPDGARRLASRLLNGEAAEALTAERRARLKLTVLNGTRVPGLAGQAAELLNDAGFVVTTVGDAPRRDQRRSQLITQSGHDEWAQAIATPLGAPVERVSASVGDWLSDFTIVVGQDFADARRQRDPWAPKTSWDGP